MKKKEVILTKPKKSSISNSSKEAKKPPEKVAKEKGVYKLPRATFYEADNHLLL